MSRAVLVNPIGSTKTRAGLTIKAERDGNTYPIGIKVSDEELTAVWIKKDKFYGDLELHRIAKNIEPYRT